LGENKDCKWKLDHLYYNIHSWIIWKTTWQRKDGGDPIMSTFREQRDAEDELLSKGNIKEIPKDELKTNGPESDDNASESG
jgi:hypothetical protein